MIFHLAEFGRVRKDLGCRDLAQVTAPEIGTNFGQNKLGH